MRSVVLTLGGLLALGTLGAAGFVWSGWYDISANVQHTQPVYSLLEKVMHQSVKLRAAGVAVPALGDATQVSRGAACFIDKCVQCHGGPGVAQHEIGRSMQPLPGPLVDASERWQPQELYWVTRNGIKMSGMPAWQYRLDDNEIWALVAFMQRLPKLTAAEFRGLATAPAGEACGSSEPQASSPANAERGRVALTQYACNACHLVPDVTGSDVHVGPPLAGIANRSLLAGAVPNTPEQLVRWIRNPQSIDPLTTMPDMNVGARDARDIAAYLATLR
jgi:mono/diheme cytochrome c family protein